MGLFFLNLKTKHLFKALKIDMHLEVVHTKMLLHPEKISTQGCRQINDFTGLCLFLVPGYSWGLDAGESLEGESRWLDLGAVLGDIIQ